MKLDKETWARVYPWLEKAQDVPVAELQEWIARIVAEDPEVGVPLRDVLATADLHDEQAFLSRPLDVPADRPNRVGQHVGAYTIDKLLAEGGMGEVWLAHRSDGHFEGTYAVKLLHLDTWGSKALDRFKREGRVLARLSHPNIARLMDAGATSDGQPFLVLEYIDGEHVDKYCETRALSTQERVRLFMDVLAAVAHAHTSLIIHRDIKPSNVLVTSGGTVKLLDFGIAKLVDPGLTVEERGQLTRVEEVVLTPSYAAPEQILGDPLSTATDVYQLGVLLHVLLVGRLPLGKVVATRSEHVKAALGETPVRMSDAVSGTQRKELRGDLDAIVEKSLRKRPQERYPTAAALSADLQRYLEHEPVTARDGMVAYRAKKFVRRYRGTVLSVSAVLASLIVATALSLTQTHKIRIERDRAERVSKFMVDMFKVVNPGEARGHEVTAREILDKASKDIDNGLNDDPQLKAQLIYTMGNTYLSLGIDAEAKRLLQQSYDLQRRTLGADSRETLQTARVLNEISRYEGKYPEAEQGIRDLVASERRLFGAKDHDFLMSELQLAETLRVEGHAAESEKISREVLAQFKDTMGPASPETVAALDQLGNALVDQDRYAEADSVLREILQTVSRTKGADDPEAMAAATRLINVLMSQSRYPEAEAMARQTLKLEEKVFGPDHPNTLNSKDHLNRVLVAEGRYAEAEPLVRELIAEDRKVFGDDRRETLRAMEVLVGCLVPLGKLSEAEAVARETWEGKKRVLGPEHPLTLHSLDNLGEVLLAEHKYPAAEAMEREVYEIRQRTLGPDRNATFVAQCDIADAMSHQGRYAEARQLLETAYQRQLQVLPPIDSLTARCRYALASIAARTGRPEEALMVLGQSIKAGLPPGDIQELLEDDDFKSMRENSDFKKLIANALPPSGDAAATKQ
jgi:tetratricopeptide (TPR) repeat protein